MIRRREFIAGLGGAAAWPLVARAQQPTIPVVGFLHQGTPEDNAFIAAAVRKGLGEMGYVEGRNVAIEYRWARNEVDPLAELAADLVRRRVAVIVTPGGTPATLAAKAATTNIPIVFGVGGDPVQFGFVASLNRPGGNLTGFTSMSLELAAKRLGFLHELLPRTTRFAALIDMNNLYTNSEITDLRAAASAIGRQIEILTVSTSHDIETAFASVAQKQISGLAVSASAFFTSRRVLFATLAARHTVATIYSDRRYTEAGGLMSYGTNTIDQYRQVGIYAGRILKGEKPADLPVQGGEIRIRHQLANGEAVRH
jgi:putative ABC transport system substrate-binding protein